MIPMIATVNSRDPPSLSGTLGEDGVVAGVSGAMVRAPGVACVTVSAAAVVDTATGAVVTAVTVLVTWVVCWVVLADTDPPPPPLPPVPVDEPTVVTRRLGMDGWILSPPSAVSWMLAIRTSVTPAFCPRMVMVASGTWVAPGPTISSRS